MEELKKTVMFHIQAPRTAKFGRVPGKREVVSRWFICPYYLIDYLMIRFKVAMKGLKEVEKRKPGVVEVRFDLGYPVF
jgi:hypothetical protein